jgi:hypothetical protein
MVSGFKISPLDEPRIVSGEAKPMDIFENF